MRRRGWNAEEACGEGAAEGDAEAAAVTLACVVMNLSKSGKTKDAACWGAVRGALRGCWDNLWTNIMLISGNVERFTNAENAQVHPAGRR